MPDCSPMYSRPSGPKSSVVAELMSTPVTVLEPNPTAAACARAESALSVNPATPTDVIINSDTSTTTALSPHVPILI